MDPLGCSARTRTCAEVMATFIAADSDAKATCNEAAGTFTITASGLPNYSSNQMTPNGVTEHDWTVTLPLTPTCADAVTDVVDSRGPIGFMINGVPFFGPQNINGQDAVITEGPTLDDCEGHSDMQCTYHYHSEPPCVFGTSDTVAAHAGDDGHPALIGYALDGFAVHAAYADEGAVELDACNGHSDETRGYHYHARAAYPYLVACYRGAKTGTATAAIPYCAP